MTTEDGDTLEIGRRDAQQGVVHPASPAPHRS
jgi:hypothetical protein